MPPYIWDSRGRVRWLLIALLLACSGCAGAQSALDPAGFHAQKIAQLWWWMLAGAVVVWTIMLVLSYYAIFARRGRHYQRLTTWVVIGGGVVFPTTVLTVLLCFGLSMLPPLLARPVDQSLVIEVEGNQWWWRVQYRQSLPETLASEADRASTELSFETANEICLPVNRAVELRLHSSDVIHAFWIPALAGKVDMIPGRVTRMTVHPFRVGNFRGACAEYCGDSHAWMNFDVRIVEQVDFEKWFTNQLSQASRPEDNAGERGAEIFRTSGAGRCAAMNERLTMKTMRCLLLVGATVVGLAGIAVVSGIVPARASSGHWPMTAWALEFAMERSVSTGSLNIHSPPLTDQSLVMRGAGHFQVGCAWCHGLPGATPSRFVLQMTPHPSVLHEELNKWSAAELFYIVRHGVKFTGMPAWPAVERDDEVWAMVAFLQTYATLDEPTYRQLAGLDEQSLARQNQQQQADLPQLVIDQCVSCHGVNGHGRGAFPSLAGQKSSYLMAALQSYRSGQRPSGTMGPLAADLTQQQMQQAADYFAAQSPRQRPLVLTGEEQAMARSLVESGDTRKRAGACLVCHPLRDSTGQAARASVTTEYPHLSGQRADYLIGQLHLFRSGQRGGVRHHIMDNMAQELSDQQIRAVARFYSSQ